MIAARPPFGPTALVRFFLRLLCFLWPGSFIFASPPAAARGLLLDAAPNNHAVIAVGERGAIIRSADSGEVWESLASPTTVTLTGVSFAPNGHGWAVGHEGVILHTRDGGETWTEQFRAEDPETVFLDVLALDAQRVIAVGAFGACYMTRDGGRTWTAKKILEEDNHLNRLTRAAIGDSEVFYAGERGTLLQQASFLQSPETLTEPDEASYYGVLPLGARTLLAYGLRGRLFRSDDGGETWKKLPSPSTALLTTAVRLRSGAIVIAGQARAFLVSRDGGWTFETWQPPLTSAVAELLEAPNGLLLAFGETGVTRLDPPAGTPKNQP
jgi:photosystem II stability/assembly factor-like uncharacterized protein